MPRFAAIGLDHRHIYDLTQGLIEAGATCVGHTPASTDPRVLAGFRKRFPDVPAVPLDQVLGDPSIAFVVIAAVPRERASLAVRALQSGKHVMTDKPGVTTPEQLADVRQAVTQTGQCWSISFGRLTTPSVQEALRLVRSGAIGRLIQVVSLAPHRLNAALRPAWFFDRAAFGGIINDIGVHSIDQFLAFADARDATIVNSTVGAFGTSRAGQGRRTGMVDDEGEPFEDFAEFTLATAAVRGYARVDWFTPDGLPGWGDGRLFLLGTEGTIELRKNLDIEGRDGGDHLFLADRDGTRHIDCAGLPVDYYRNFLTDIRTGTRTVMPQEDVFTVCRLALAAQDRATRFAPAEAA